MNVLTVIHMDIFHRQKLGWITLNSSQCKSLTPSSQEHHSDQEKGQVDTSPFVEIETDIKHHDSIE